MSGTEGPTDSAIQERVRRDFEAQPAMRLIGAELTSISAGTVEIEFGRREELTQQHGFLHAGILALALDAVCGFAALSLMPAGSGVVSVEFKINLLSPAVAERFRAVGRVRRSGRTISVCSADAFALHDDGAKLVAAMQGTMMRLTE